jgi:flagellar FliJ protein
MTRFTFRLQSVLRLRQRAEEHQALALASATHALIEAERVLDAERRRLAGAHESLAVAGRSGAQGVEIQELAAAVDASASSVGVAREQRATAAARVEAARARLVEASRDRETLERLEEGQRAAAAKVVEGHERRTLDDMASIYHLWRGARDTAASADKS